MLIVLVEGGTKAAKPYCDITRCTNRWSQYSQVGSIVNHLPYTYEKKRKDNNNGIFACGNTV